MNGFIFYAAGHTNALDHTVQILRKAGCNFVSQPDHTVTHLLLDVPSFDTNGLLKSGDSVADLLKKLSRNVVIIGGNLQHPALSGYPTVDLLQDPVYLAENADITAHCAIKLITSRLPVILKGCQILVIGWGRIGKCIARLLREMGAIVTVAARKESDRAILSALGYDTEDTNAIDYSLIRYRVIVNTVPTLVLTADALQYCQPECLKIDLASAKGIESDDTLWARGLPNKDAPGSSGALIARSILRLR